MKAVSLFSGGGGLDIGLEDAGFETVLATDADGVFCQTLRSNQCLGAGNEAWFKPWFQHVVSQKCYRKTTSHEIEALRLRLRSGLGNHRYLRRAVVMQKDVRMLTASTVMEACDVQRAELALIFGGPPCQSFSRSGKRESVNDERGQLFMEFVRLVDELRPRWILFENVKGLVQTRTTIWKAICRECKFEHIPPFDSSRRQPAVDELPQECSRCKSRRTYWQLIHNKVGGALDLILAEFERLGYTCQSAVLDAADFGAPQFRERLFIIGSRDAEHFSFPKPTHGKQNGLPLFPDLESCKPYVTMKEALGSLGSKDVDRHDAVLWLKNVVRPHDEPVTWTLERPSPTVGAHQSAKFAIAPRGVPHGQLARQQWHVLGRRQGDTAPVPVDHRYLTDSELLELQTFPAFWYLAGTRMERAFQIGNAVPPVLARAVGKAMTAEREQAAVSRKTTRESVGTLS